MTADHFFRIPQVKGVHLDHYSALSVAATFACVGVIAKNIAQCTWDVVEEMPNGDCEYRPTAPAYRLFNLQPNSEMTAQNFKEQMFIVALLWGQAFAEIEFDKAGRPQALWPLEPDRCYLDRDANQRKVVRVQNYNRPETVLRWDQVYAISGPGIGMYPFDMVAIAARTLAQALAADTFGLKFYEHGTAMGGVLSTDNPKITEEQLKPIRERVEKQIGGAENAFKFLILGGGLKLQPWSQSLRDDQYNEVRNLLIEEICRFWGVPPHKIAHLVRSTNNNIEHQGLEYTRDTLTRWTKIAEQEAFSKLFGRSRLRLLIDMDQLAEGDAKSIAETDGILVSHALRTRNELRRKRGWNSLGPVGDTLTIQGAMTTLQAVKDAPAPRQNPAPTRPEEAPEEEPEDNRRAAAVAVYAAALKRGMYRQFRRAANIADDARDAGKFRERVLAYQYEHAQYVDRQFDEALYVTHQIGMNGNSAAVRAAVKQETSAELGLLVEAFARGDLSSWCDIEARANAIASELVNKR